MSQEPETTSEGEVTMPDESPVDSPDLPAVPEKYLDRLAEMEKMLAQVESEQREYLVGRAGIKQEQVAQKSTGSGADRKTMNEAIQEGARSYTRANSWISVVIVGVTLMVAPGIVGHYLDQNWGKPLLGPAGILIGMITGLIYLMRAGEKIRIRNGQ